MGLGKIRRICNTRRVIHGNKLHETNKITKGKTSIIIAHRLSTVESADKIIYMESGKILEYGNHKELLNIPKGKFKRLYEEQFMETELV